MFDVTGLKFSPIGSKRALTKMVIDLINEVNSVLQIRLLQSHNRQYSLFPNANSSYSSNASI
jgi:hypothetical protein